MLTTATLVDGILAREGGYVNDPVDRGGPTHFGITQTTLKDYRRQVLRWTVSRSKVTTEDIRTLTQEEARAIYRTLYIEGPRFDEIADTMVRRLVVDWGVHSGQALAARRLQRAVGRVLEIALKIDGIVGPKTLAAVNQANGWAVAHRLVLARAEHQANLIRASVRAVCPQALTTTKLRYDRGWRQRHLSLLA